MPARPTSDWSVVRIYPRVLRPIGPAKQVGPGVKLFEALEKNLGGTCMPPVGPGVKLFEALEKNLGGEVPIIAEDLGVITPDVNALREEIQAPGMVVLQFAWEGGSTNVHLPHNHYVQRWA
eukprot:448460-Prorocentrum_minimum.AAC.1